MFEELFGRKEDKEKDKDKSKKDECPVKKYTIIKDGKARTVKEENGVITIYEGLM